MTASSELSFAQQGLWFLEQVDPGASGYALNAAYDLTQPCSVELLGDALRAVIARHQPLRTRFVDHDGEPRAIVEPAPSLALSVRDVAGDGELAAAFADFAAVPFDLAVGPPCRFQLIRVGRSAQVLLAGFHHLISDGVSLAIFLDELAAALAALEAGRAIAFAPLDADHDRFVLWERAQLGESRRAELTRFWSETMAAAPTGLTLASEVQLESTAGLNGAVEILEIAPPLVEAIDRFARAHDLTPFTVLFGAYAWCVGNLADTDDIVIGVPFGGRNMEGAERLVGLFVNTLPIRVHLDPALSVEAYLDGVRDRVLDVFEHHDLPFSQLVRQLGPERSGDRRNPVYQLVFNAQPSGATTSRFRHRRMGVDSSPFDLTVSVVDSPGGGQAFMAVRDRTRVSAEVVRWCLRGFAAVLAAMVADGSRRLGDLGLLDRADEAAVRELGRGTPAGPATTPVDMFVEQARRHPSRIAVEDGRTRLTYRELDVASARLAAQLRAAGVRSGQTVGVLLDRQVGIVVVLLAIWRAGAVYLPLDENYPDERLQTMLRIGGVTRVVTSDDRKSRVLALGAQPVIRDLEGRSGIAVAEPPRGPVPDDVAYLLFTSGSTGQPKAAAIEHRSLADRLRWSADEYGMSGGLRLLAKTPIGFDYSISELGAVCGGATVVLAPAGAELDGAALATLVHGAECEHIHFVPSVLRALAPALLAHGPLPMLRHVVFGGEALRTDLVETARQLAPHARVDNMYGPVECTIDVLTGAVDGARGGRVPLGRPHPGVALEVRNRFGTLVPPGGRGELIICGRYCQRGASGGDPDARRHPTGDQVDWQGDGSFLFIGRRDLQTKVRGVRIELEEIEAALRGIAGVEDAAALYDAGTLSAFVVGDPKLTAEGVVEALLRRLPPAMVPARISRVAALPRLPSGKVDRRALAGMAADEIGPDGRGDALDGVARQVADVWATVLEVEPPATLAAHFFALGGHSLLVPHLVAELRRALGVEVAVRDLYRRATLRDQVALVSARLAAAAPAFAQAVTEPPMAQPTCAPTAQEQSLGLIRLLGLQPFDPGFLIGGCYRAADGLSIDRLESCLQELVADHPPLHSHLVTDEAGNLVRADVTDRRLVIERTADARLDAAPDDDTVHAVAGDALAEMFARGIELGAAPPLRVRAIHGSATRLVVFAAHHSAIDAEGLRALIREVERRLAGPHAPSGRAWSEAVATAYRRLTAEQERSRSEDAAAHRSWGEVLRGYELPTYRSYRGRNTRGAARATNTPLVHQAIEPVVRAGRGTPHVAWSTLLAFAVNGRMLERPVDTLILPAFSCVREELDGVRPLGYSLDVLVLRVPTDPRGSLLDAVDVVRTQTERALGNQSSLTDLLSHVDEVCRLMMSPSFPLTIFQVLQHQARPDDGTALRPAVTRDFDDRLTSVLPVDALITVSRTEESTSLAVATDQHAFGPSWASELCGAVAAAARLLGEQPALWSAPALDVVRRLGW